MIPASPTLRYVIGWVVREDGPETFMRGPANIHEWHGGYDPLGVSRAAKNELRTLIAPERPPSLRTVDLDKRVPCAITTGPADVRRRKLQLLRAHLDGHDVMQIVVSDEEGNVEAIVALSPADLYTMLALGGFA